MDTPPLRSYDALILAGGMGSRVQGQDKGLLTWQGQPLIEHMLNLLQKQPPPPERVYISANRNLERYQQIAAQRNPFRTTEVITDLRAGSLGPLAGIEATLTQRITQGRLSPLLILPCDTPRLPDHIMRTFSTPFKQDATVNVYATSASGPHPLCCLVQAFSLETLSEHLNQGQRRVRDWLDAIQAQPIWFEEDHWFKNFNDMASFEDTTLPPQTSQPL